MGYAGKMLYGGYAKVKKVRLQSDESIADYYSRMVTLPNQIKNKKGGGSAEN